MDVRTLPYLVLIQVNEKKKKKSTINRNEQKIDMNWSDGKRITLLYRSFFSSSPILYVIRQLFSAQLALNKNCLYFFLFICPFRFRIFILFHTGSLLFFALSQMLSNGIKMYIVCCLCDVKLSRKENNSIQNKNLFIL